MWVGGSENIIENDTAVAKPAILDYNPPCNSIVIFCYRRQLYFPLLLVEIVENNAIRVIKWHISGQSDVKQWKNQAHSLIELCLAEGISK